VGEGGEGEGSEGYAVGYEAGLGGAAGGVAEAAVVAGEGVGVRKGGEGGVG
jgi:hypothetical protein